MFSNVVFSSGNSLHVTAGEETELTVMVLVGLEDKMIDCSKLTPISTLTVLYTVSSVINFTLVSALKLIL